jgi:hypothetical protein
LLRALLRGLLLLRLLRERGRRRQDGHDTGSE